MMFLDKKQAARWAAVLLVLVVAYLVIAKAAGAQPSQLPEFSGKVVSPKNARLSKNRQVKFSYTVRNSGLTTLRNILVIFDKKIFGQRSWFIKELPPGILATKVLTATYPKSQRRGEFCAKAILGVMGLYWSTTAAEPCYYRLV